MAEIGDIPVRLPPKQKLRTILKSSNDVQILHTYLRTVAQQPKGQENGLRILLQTCAEIGHERFVEIVLDRGANIDAAHETSLPALLYAVQGGHVDTVKLLLSRGANINGTDSGKRTAVMLAASSGKLEVLKILLDQRADIGVQDKQGRSAVMHAVAGGHADALKVLFDYGADAQGRDVGGKTLVMYAASNVDCEMLDLLLQHRADLKGVDTDGRGPLMHAIMNEKASMDDKVRILTMLLRKGADVTSTGEIVGCLRHAALAGQNRILELLVQHKANINAVDENGRSPLLHLASDTAKTPKWNRETVSIILNAGANVDHSDKDRRTMRRRTALQWAASTGHLILVQEIFNHVPPGKPRKLVNDRTSRGKTALHLASQHGQSNMVRLLLNYGANIEAASEGLWTPLLIAAKAGHADVVAALLSARTPANVNARTSSGMTALHWAAENGYERVVERILADDRAWKNPKDSFHTTPLLRAGQHGHVEIVQLLKPYLFGGSLNDHALHACKEFTASVVDFYVKAGTFDRNEVRRMPVWEILYAEDPKDERKFSVTTKLDDIRKGTPSFRWIHLPANNIAWAEAMITKMFVENGPIDISGFRAILRVFGQHQHRGPKVHSRFMRPLCQHHVSEQIHPRPVQPSHPRSNKSPTPKTMASTADLEASPAVNLPPSPTSPLAAKPPKTPKTPKTAPLNLEIASPTPSGKTQDTPDRPPDTHNHQTRKNGVVIFMPYLHWEADSNRLSMRNTVNEVMEQKDLPFNPQRSKDECLIQGYLRQSTDLHLRRTLDQFKHHGIITDKRDRDQVVYRFYQRAKADDPKIFMVDQMWIWVFDGILITCFPERWGQPVRDPLSLFDGLIEDINSKTQPPVKSVYELAALITNRCTGSFDRHEWGYEDLDYKFFEMFELSIGIMTRRSTALLERFERDSAAAARWLKAHDRAYQVPIEPTYVGTKSSEDRDNEEDEWLNEPDGEIDIAKTDPNPIFVNRLLNIAKEAQLLVECKDIEDELSILTAVLQQQRGVLQDMGQALKELSSAHGATKQDMPKKCGQQKRLVDQHLLDIERMRKQAKRVNESLHQVLDLKQKHANALEARFARDQAQDTARQGRTILVFTIVTIVFLPMSFMASFFAINIVEFPHDLNVNSAIPLGYVAKYLFGIGLGVSLPLIAVAFVFADVHGWMWSFKSWLKHSFAGKSDQTKSAQHAQPPPTRVKDDKLSMMDSEDYNPYRRPPRTFTGATGGTLDSVDVEANHPSALPISSLGNLGYHP
jgi:ankyrin repeat protein/Mg2+ and Co2+ transporter CorA